MTDWLQRAKDESTPIIDGERAIFIWQAGPGEGAPLLLGDFNNWQPAAALPFTETQPGLWRAELTLPADAYIEYAYFQAPESPARTPDPFNPRTVDNGMGEMQNYFTMPGYAPNRLIEQRGDRYGMLSRHVIENPFLIAGAERPVHLYAPPVEEPVPLLVVLDGEDYRRRGRLVHIVENLMAEKRIRPVALAMIENGAQARFIEYATSDATIMLLLAEVLPLAGRELHLLDVTAHPGAFGMMGASMGGLMSLYTALRVPEVFGKVLSQSGAFLMREELAGREFETVVYALIRAGAAREALDIWMDWGRYEIWSSGNTRMRDLLSEQGYRAAFRQYNAGHNYTAWRDDLWRGLEALFPPV